MDIFEAVTEEIDKEGNVEGLEIEHAMMVNPGAGSITPGVHISATEFHSPLFLSTGELRAMADEADLRTQHTMNK